MKVQAAIDEADIGQVRVGQRAFFTVDSYPDKQFKGVVSEVQLNPAVTNNVVTYNVVMEVDNEPRTALPPPEGGTGPRPAGPGGNGPAPARPGRAGHPGIHHGPLHAARKPGLQGRPGAVPGHDRRLHHRHQPQGQHPAGAQRGAALQPGAFVALDDKDRPRPAAARPRRPPPLRAPPGTAPAAPRAPPGAWSPGATTGLGPGGRQAQAIPCVAGVSDGTFTEVSRRGHQRRHDGAHRRGRLQEDPDARAIRRWRRHAADCELPWPSWNSSNWRCSPSPATRPGHSSPCWASSSGWAR